MIEWSNSLYITYKHLRTLTLRHKCHHFEEILIIGCISGEAGDENFIKMMTSSFWWMHMHYCDIIMGAMASQITSLTTDYSAVYSGADQRKHKSSASLAFVRRINRWPVNSPHKGPVTRKTFPFDVITSWIAFTPIHQGCFTGTEAIMSLGHYLNQ